MISTRLSNSITQSPWSLTRPGIASTLLDALERRLHRLPQAHDDVNDDVMPDTTRFAAFSAAAFQASRFSGAVNPIRSLVLIVEALQPPTKGYAM